MNYCIKGKGKRMTALLLVLVLALSMFSTTAFAAQEDNYHDPAEHWLSAVNRTNELDANATVTHETFVCSICRQPTSFMVWRTPEYSRDGVTALSRNVKYSDGTCIDGESVGVIFDGTPGKDAYYTGYHWTKAMCEICGTMHSNGGGYMLGKNVYYLYDCAAEFTEELPEQVKYEYADSTYHTKTTKGGSYCCFCFGTNHTSSSVLERHNMQTEIIPQIGNDRFAIVKHCTDCEYTSTTYVAAKSVIADYYGVVDGQPHTVTISDLSEAGVSTQIRYGNSAESCTLTSAPNYTEKGQYAVYYEITYSYSGMTMTENGVANVWLHDEKEDTDCPCGCGDPDCDCKNPDCNGSCHKGNCGDKHNYVVLETVNPTCKTLGYTRYLCVDCGKIEKRDYVNAIGHAWQSMEGQQELIASAEEKSSAFSFSQEIIDAVLTRGSNVEESKFRIYEQFQKSLSAKENADFLKDEYGWGGSYPVIAGTGIDEQHDGMGITLTKKGAEQAPSITLNWNKVEKRIAELIRMDRYLNPKEVELYPAWLAKQEERRQEQQERQTVREVLDTAPPAKEPDEAAHYEYHLGDKIYFGADEFEILSLAGDRVLLYDTKFPLFQREETRADFERKVQENPLNDHLIPDVLEDKRLELENVEKQLENAKAEVGKPFPQEEKLQQMTTRLNELDILLNLDKKENELADDEPDEGEALTQEKDRGRER